MLKQYPAAVRFSFIMLSIVLFFYILIIAKLFLYPIALAVLFSYLLYPLTSFLEKLRIPRIIAIILCIIILFSLMSGALLFIYTRVGVFVGDFPGFRSKALSNIDLMESRIEDIFGITDLSIADFLRSRVAILFDVGNDFFNRLFTATAGTLFRFGILPVFIFMLLYYRTKFAYFILKLVGPQKRMMAIHVLREVSKVASRYMGGIFTVVFVMCCLNSLGFILIDLKYPIVLGVIAAMFSFIPHFGSIIGYTIPFAFALLTGDPPSIALRVLLMLLIVQFLEHNILMPNIVGSYMKLNPFIIILGVIASGMVWGIPGMFIVVPVLAVFRIIFINIESLKPYGYLLGSGGTRRHALTGENIQKFMQRFRKN